MLSNFYPSKFNDLIGMIISRNGYSLVKFFNIYILSIIYWITSSNIIQIFYFSYFFVYNLRGDRETCSILMVKKWSLDWNWFCLRKKRDFCVIKFLFIWRVYFRCFSLLKLTWNDRSEFKKNFSFKLIISFGAIFCCC